MTGPPPARLLSGKEWFVDPYPAYAELRRDWPVARTDWPQQGAGTWLLSCYADVHRALASSGFSVEHDLAELGSVAAGDLSPSAAAEREPLGGTMISVDPPKHTRLRAPVSRAFTPQRVQNLRPRIVQMVDELMEAPTRRGHFDLVSELAMPLPAMVIAELLGVSRDHIGKFCEWTHTWVARGPTFGPGPVSHEVETAVSNLRSSLRDTIVERSREPRDDLISALLATRDERDPLTERELVSTSLLLLGAGFETTTNLISNGVKALVRNPGAYEQLASNLAGMPTAVEELLRYDCPVQDITRIATKEFEVKGVVIPAGAFVGLNLASANRDPAQFENPDALLLDRQPNPHVSFAHGVHFCLGANLARMTAAIAFTTLLERFKTLALVPDGRTRAPNPYLRGYTRMELTGDLRGVPR